MQPRPDPRLVFTHSEYAAGRLDLGPYTPSIDEGAGERGIREVDRDRVVEHATSAGGCDRPTVGTAIFIQPSGDLSVALAETAGRNSKPDADGEAPLGHSDHLSRVARH